MMESHSLGEGVGTLLGGALGPVSRVELNLLERRFFSGIDKFIELEPDFCDRGDMGGAMGDMGGEFNGEYSGGKGLAGS